MIPPSAVPWPPMNFVAEWTTMSAPHSIGRHRIRRGERVVDDQRDAVLVRDLGDRREIGDVAGRVADRLGEERLGVGPDRRRERRRLRRPETSVTSIPIRLSVTLNCVTVPP